MKMKNISLFCLLLITGLGVLSCGPSGSEVPTDTAEVESNTISVTAEQFNVSKMEVGSMEDQPFFRYIQANGYIDVPPERMASVSVRLGGFVKLFSILPGDRVSKGTVLFTLENPDFIQLQQDYLEAKAQLHYLESDYERQKNLASDNVASQKNYLKAESDYKVTQARFLGLKEKLKLLNIDTQHLEKGEIQSTINVYSPISGFVAKVNITRGMFVHPEDVAVEIIDTDHMHVELQVFERDIVDIRKGQSITFTIPGASNNVFKGEIYLVGKTIESESRTINIHGHIDDEQGINTVLPGMYVEANIAVSSDTRTVLPSEAIVALGDTHYVLVQISKEGSGYLFEKREVSIGEFNNQWTEIRNLNDFKTGDVFLVKGAFNLINEEGGGHQH